MDGEAEMPAGGDPRAVLEALARARGADLSALSRLIGRNPAYVQQYVKRGSPRVLAERDRRLLAEYFDVDEALLGGPAEAKPAKGALTRVPRLDVGAAAGAGSLPEDERALGRIGFPAGWLRRIARGGAQAVSIIRVEGDSMLPTLAAGDEILVDRGDAGGAVRDGIYVLRLSGALIVKRLARAPRGRLSIRSDNPAYPSWEDQDPADVEIVGRVVWVGRTL